MLKASQEKAEKLVMSFEDSCWTVLKLLACHSLPMAIHHFKYTLWMGKDTWPKSLAWVHLEISDQSVQLFKKELSNLNASTVNLIILNGINLQKETISCFHPVCLTIYKWSSEAFISWNLAYCWLFFRDGHQQWVQPIQVQALKLSLLLLKASTSESGAMIYFCPPKMRCCA